MLSIFAHSLRLDVEFNNLQYFLASSNPVDLPDPIKPIPTTINLIFGFV